MKKTSLPLLLLAGLAGGCRSVPPQLQSTPTTRLVSSHPAPVGVRIPEVVRSYAVGAYVDPDDSSVRHDAHWIQRVESPARWDLRSPMPVAVPEVPVASAVAVASVAVEATPRETVAVPPPTAPLEPALTANAEGVIDLTAARAEPEPLGNPFAVIVPDKATTREVMLQVSGVVGGAHPCTVINDRLAQAGDVVEGIAIERVEERSVLLRWGESKFRVPVGESPVRVRLPL